MEEARVIRNQRKRVLGRHLNTLSRLIVEEHVNGANVRLASIAENDARGVFESQLGSHGGLSEELATYLSLPKVEIPIFNGDPREYQHVHYYV